MTKWSSRVRIAASACLVWLGLILGGAGGAIALAEPEPGSWRRPTTSQSDTSDDKRPRPPARRTAKTRSTRRRTDSVKKYQDADQTGRSRKSDDREPATTTSRPTRNDQRPSDNDHTDRATTTTTSRERRSPREYDDDKRNDARLRATSRRRPRATSHDDSDRANPTGPAAVVVAVDSSRRVFAPTPCREMQLPPPRLDLASPGYP